MNLEKLIKRIILVSSLYDTWTKYVETVGLVYEMQVSLFGEYTDRGILKEQIA